MFLNMNRPVLSICIPTYNREQCLGDCLDSIVTQFENPEVYRQVEIVISDNASTDDTETLVQTFQKSYNNIRYIKNDSNLGFDRNVLQVVEKSTGTYCLTLGDDDALFSDSLTYLLTKIEKVKSPYYMLNPRAYDSKLREPAGSYPNFRIQEDQSFDSLSDFVETIDAYSDVVGYFCSMSTQLFLRSAWMDFKQKNEYVGTNIIHMHILLSVFKDTQFVLLAKPTIITRNNNLRWDTYPGLETTFKRSGATLKTLLWINDVYTLNISKTKAKAALYLRGSVITLKDIIKFCLARVGIKR